MLLGTRKKNDWNYDTFLEKQKFGQNFHSIKAMFYEFFQQWDTR